MFFQSTCIYMSVSTSLIRFHSGGTKGEVELQVQVRIGEKVIAYLEQLGLSSSHLIRRTIQLLESWLLLWLQYLILLHVLQPLFTLGA